MLAERSFTQAIVIDLPDGYRHELLDFPALTSLKGELPEACASYVTDLSMKRNVGLRPGANAAMAPHILPGR